MKVTFNGTASSEGFPSLFCECKYCSEARKFGWRNLRRRSSVTVDDSILIDFNADTYSASLYGKLDLTKVKHILFTHSHEDHCYLKDLRGIIRPCAETSRKEPLYIYGNRKVYEKYLESGISEYEKEGYLRFNILELNRTLKIGDYRVTPLEGRHSGEDEDSMLFIVEKGGRTFFYGLDSGSYTECFWENIRRFRIDVAVFDCSTVESRSPFETHQGIPENIQMRERMNREGIIRSSTRIYLSHFIHNYNSLYENIERISRKYGFYQAYDNLEIEV